MLPLAAGGYFVLIATASTVYKLGLDETGAVVAPLTPVESRALAQDAMIEDAGRVLVAFEDPVAGEILLACYVP
jgi:hypothetical protein